RDLALQIGVSRKTTLDVFERLIAEGYLRSRAGSGTFVAEATQGLAGRTPQRSSAEQIAAPAPTARTFATLWNDVPDVLPMP
ncbi:PLP-dependent aminotransferase family protein, partial [Acinetobacter baumannii]